MPDDRFEDGATIPEFPNYKITSYGRVLNEWNEEMTLSPTMNGDLTVGLTKDGKQYRRSVKVLVARAFVPGESALHDTPLQLDGDKLNLHAVNIVWRPRWLAWQYNHMFDKWKAIPDFTTVPVIELNKNDQFDCVLDAAIETGSLCEHIHESTFNGRPVYPQGERYKIA